MTVTKRIAILALTVIFLFFMSKVCYAQEFVSREEGLDIVFVIDSSGSMKKNDSASRC